jgi:hypothetical protein
MQTTPAYSEISAARIRLGNAWLERVWSVIPGQSQSLIDRQTGKDWFTAPSPEFRFEEDSVPVGPKVCGTPEWSEVYAPAGAGVEVRYSGTAIGVFVHTIAFHDAPGMLRRITLKNVSPNPITAGHAALDILPIRHGGSQVYTRGYQRRTASARLELEDRAVAVMHNRRGLFLGIENGGAYALFDPNPEFCTLGCPDQCILQPGDTWRLPPTIIAAFTGPPEAAAQGPLAQVLLMARKLQRREEMIRRDRSQ